MVWTCRLEKLGLFAQEHQVSLLMASGHSGLTHVLPKKASGELKEFADFIERYTQELYQHPDPVPLVKQMIDETAAISILHEASKNPRKNSYW